MKFSDLLSSPGRFLMLGKCVEELQALKAAKWSGLAFHESWGKLSDEDYYSDIKYFDGYLSTSSHFMQLIDGTWVKPITVKDIFDQFGGDRYDLIIIKVPGLTRNLWYSEQIQVHMPRWHVIEEDGHNEAVIEQAHTLHYASRQMEGDWLLMAK